MNDHYLNRTVDKLASDPIVKAYVLEGEQSAAWEAWLEEHPAEAVKMMKVQRQLLQQEAATTQGDQELATSSEQNITPEEETATEQGVGGIRGWVHRKEWGKVVLATVVALASLFYLYTIKFGGELYKTEAGEQRIITLEKGSKIHLAPESILRVKNGEDVREVNLSGDAFFEVVEGLPFLVNTPIGEIETESASFSVDARDAFVVACATGQVRVSHRTDETLLNPGFAVSNTAAGLSQVSSIDIASVASWRSGRLQLKEKSVAEVIKQFERYYSRGFKVENSLRSKKIDIELPTNNFPLAIERVNFVLQVEVDTNRRMIRLD